MDIEELAAAQHEIWSHWMKYQFSKCYGDPYDGLVIPDDLVERWHRQMNTPYSELSESEKESDRAIVRQFIKPALEEGELPY